MVVPIFYIVFGVLLFFQGLLDPRVKEESQRLGIPRTFVEVSMLFFCIFWAISIPISMAVQIAKTLWSGDTEKS